MQQQTPVMPVMASFPPTNITTEQIQKYLDENKKLILAILDNQNLGKLAECAQYQAQLQKNLMYLAAIADAQPQTPAMSSPMAGGGGGGGASPHPGMQQGGPPPAYYMHPQASGMSPQQQQQQQHQLQQQPGHGQVHGHGGFSPSQKMHMQFGNSPQMQMHQQMNVRPPGNGVMHHMHPEASMSSRQNSVTPETEASGGGGGGGNGDNAKGAAADHDAN